MKFEDICSIGICDVCGVEDNVVVCASSMGPISYSYCKDCLEKGLEPYKGMVAYISCVGRFPEDVNEIYQKEVRRILSQLNIPESKFIEDVNESIRKLYDYFDKREGEKL